MRHPRRQLSPAGFIAIGAVLCIAASLAADEPQAGGKPDDKSTAGVLFDKLDANADGQLTTDEVPEDKQTLFRRLLRTSDSDKDGKLSRSEFAAGLESRRPQRPLRETLPEQSPGGPLGMDPEKTFARLDANGDGKIVAGEVPDQARGMFERMLARADKDGDGAITKQELTDAVNSLKAATAKPGQAEPGRMFDYLDKNADGKLSADEIPDGRPMLAQMFKRGDKDGDGALSRDEFLAAMTALRNLQQGQPNGDTPGTGGERKPGANMQRVMRRLSKMDADHDGKVSRDEFAEVQKKRFGKIDANGDGYLEMSEIQAQTAAMGQKVRGKTASGGKADRKSPGDEAAGKKDAD